MAFNKYFYAFCDFTTGRVESVLIGNEWTQMNELFMIVMTAIERHESSRWNRSLWISYQFACIMEYFSPPFARLTFARFDNLVTHNLCIRAKASREEQFMERRTLFAQLQYLPPNFSVRKFSTAGLLPACTLNIHSNLPSLLSFPANKSCTLNNSAIMSSNQRNWWFSFSDWKLPRGISRK